MRSWNLKNCVYPTKFEAAVTQALFTRVEDCQNDLTSLANIYEYIAAKKVLEGDSPIYMSVM